MIEQAIYEAVRKGTLVVAASGNDGDTGTRSGTRRASRTC